MKKTNDYEMLKTRVSSIYGIMRKDVSNMCYDNSSCYPSAMVHVNPEDFPYIDTDGGDRNE